MLNVTCEFWRKWETEIGRGTMGKWENIEGQMIKQKTYYVLDNLVGPSFVN